MTSTSRHDGLPPSVRLWLLGLALVVLASCERSSPVSPEPDAGMGALTSPFESFGPTRFAGRVRAILAVREPGQPAALWAASASGGLWVSRNDGTSWSAVDDFLESLTFSSLATAPSRLSTMYAGSGEIHPFLHHLAPSVPLSAMEGLILRSPRRGAGIFRSVDSGRTWRQLPATGIPDFFYVNGIAVHPTRPEIVLAATATGLFRSSDGGDTWNPVSHPPGTPSLAGTIVLDVRFHPTTRGLSAVAGTLNQGLWFSQSDDAGADAAQWERSRMLGASANIPEPTMSSRMEVHPSAFNLNVWFAAYILNEQFRLLRSADGGRTFDVLHDASPVQCPLHNTTDAVPLLNSRFYTGALWVDPTSEQRILLGGIRLCGSTDGGRTFFEVGHETHNDYHDIIHHPTLSGAVLVANDGGVARIFRWGSETDRETTALTSNLGIQQFTSAARNPISGIVVGGAQDIGTLRRDNAGVWTEVTRLGGVAGSDGMTVATNPQDPAFWYFGKSIARLRRSDDGALTHACIAGSASDPLRAILDMTNDFPGCTPTDPPGRDPREMGVTRIGRAACLGPTPILLDPRDPRTLYVGCASLWRTRGATEEAPGRIEWDAIGPALAAGHVISAFDVARSDPETAWLGTVRSDSNFSGTVRRDRQLWFSHQFRSLAGAVGAGATGWTLAPELSALPTRPVGRVVIDPRNPGRVYVAFSGWASPTDSAVSQNLWRGVEGNTPMWTDISAGLPGGPIHALAVHPTQEG